MKIEPQSDKKQRTKERTKRRRLIGAVLLLLLLVGDYTLYPMLSPMGGRSFDRGQNASWLRDRWYLGSETEAVASLAQRLTQERVRDAYFHVRFIKKDGSLRFHELENAHKVLWALKKAAPAIRPIAWVYIGNARGLTGVDLSNGKVRQKIVGEMKWLTEKCGFAGVQIDYEIVSEGDADLLKLLRETRIAVGPHKTLSLATAMWLPPAFSAWGWSEKYFGEVSEHCDQIVVMAYDSALYFPRHYVWLVRQQAIRVTRAVAESNPKCRVLIGVPTYQDGGPSHHLHSENILMALKGVREGLASPAARPNVFAGVAIFADYSTDEKERAIYHRWWLQKD